MITKQELCHMALEARKKAYSPYSHFKVGAAILAKNGQVFTGCNIENAAYTPSNCAERTAVFKAVSEGVTQFAMLAVVGGKGDAETLPIAAPCGVCRQVLNEFCELEMPVLLVKGENDYMETTLGELLPMGFGPKDLA